jgi:ribosome modulation factor
MANDPSFEQLDAAFSDGKRVGLQASGDIRTCPFGRDQPTFRAAWLNGFVVGQAKGPIDTLLPAQPPKADPQQWAS